MEVAAERWAEGKGIPCALFPADWKQYGKAAGPKRNKAMAQAVEALIALYDGKSKGTANMIQEARKAGLQVYVKPYRGKTT